MTRSSTALTAVFLLLAFFAGTTIPKVESKSEPIILDPIEVIVTVEMPEVIPVEPEIIEVVTTEVVTETVIEYVEVPVIETVYIEPEEDPEPVTPTTAKLHYIGQTYYYGTFTYELDGFLLSATLMPNCDGEPIYSHTIDLLNPNYGDLPINPIADTWQEGEVLHIELIGSE